jgi:hypothetical protein
MALHSTPAAHAAFGVPTHPTRKVDVERDDDLAIHSTKKEPEQWKNES